MDSHVLCLDCGTRWIVQQRSDDSELYGCLRCGGVLEPGVDEDALAAPA